MSAEQKNGVWAGFDLGGTKMLAMIFDDKFKPLGRRRKKTKGHEGETAGIARICSTIQDALDEAKVDRSELAGIGMGCPGPLDLDRGIMIDAPNLGWENVNIRQAIEREFRCPVVIANDVDLGVYGEYRRGAARGGRCVLGVFPGTGIGGGCVYEGKIIRGKSNSCMEFGHVCVIPDGPLCGCGLRGCLEAVASRLAISSAAAAAAYRGQAPKLRQIAGTNVSEIRSGALAESVAGGDVIIKQLLLDAAKHIGVAVGGFIHLFSPDIVVLGGGLVEALPELFVSGVREAATSHVLPSYRESFQVVAAKLGDDATATGAATWAAEVVEHLARG